MRRAGISYGETRIVKKKFLRFARWVLWKLFGDEGKIKWTYNWNRKYTKSEAYGRTDAWLGLKPNIDPEQEEHEDEIARKFIKKLGSKKRKPRK